MDSAGVSWRGISRSAGQSKEHMEYSPYGKSYLPISYHPSSKRYMRILLFSDLNYKFNTHTHTCKILSTIEFELDTHIWPFSLKFLL